MENSLIDSQTDKYKVVIRPDNSIFTYIHRSIENIHAHKSLHTHIQAISSIITKKWKHLKCPSPDEQIKCAQDMKQKL